MKHPAVHFIIDWQEDQVVATKLALAPRFELCFSGDIPKSASQAMRGWVQDYLEGHHRPFPSRLKKEGLTPFSQKVLDAMEMIPFGETLSYGEVAQKIGSPRGMRAVGNACRLNPFPLIIPCHRVISSTGKIGGFAYDLRIKEALLAFEGPLAQLALK